MLSYKKNQEATPKPTKPCPIPDEDLRSWILSAVSIFQHFMPEIDAHYPDIHCSLAGNFVKVRTKLLEQTGCPIKEFPPTSTMEYIHGDKGGAILIRRELLADIPHETLNDLIEPFLHFLWHELGHFYAINTEAPHLHHYSDPGLADESPVLDMSPERKKQEGYWMWQEFIAEAIANRVDYLNRKDSGSYHPEQIVWTPDVWNGVMGRLDGLLGEAMSHYNSTIDEYALAHYFAYLLTNDLCMYYVQAAEEGKLIDGGDVEPTGISDLMEEYQPALRRLHGILADQIERDDYWMVGEDVLEGIGDCIAELMEVKLELISMIAGL